MPLSVNASEANGGSGAANVNVIRLPTEGYAREFPESGLLGEVLAPARLARRIRSIARAT